MPLSSPLTGSTGVVYHLRQQRATDNLTTREVIEVWRAYKAGAILDVVTDLLNDTVLPEKNDTYVDDTSMLVTNRDIASVDNEEGRCYDITITYSKPGQYPSEEQNVVRFSNATYTRVVDVAWNTSDKAFTNAIINSAGDPFDPPVQQEYSNLRVSITKNFVDGSGFVVSNIQEFQNTVNLNEETIVGMEVPAKRARMVNIEAYPFPYVNDFGNTTTFWKVTFLIEIYGEEWGANTRILDRGFNYLDDSGIKQPYKVGDDDDQSSEPVLLDGSGGQLGDGDDPVFLDFLTFEPKDWSTLSIPSTLVSTPIQDALDNFFTF